MKNTVQKYCYFLICANKNAKKMCFITYFSRFLTKNTCFLTYYSTKNDENEKFATSLDVPGLGSGHGNGHDGLPQAGQTDRDPA
jgi:hypothetical protein